MPSDRDAVPVEFGRATIPGGRDAPSLARALVTGWLNAHGHAALREDACLLISELVTNSVVHAGQPAGAPVEIQAVGTNGVVRFEVQDLGHGPVWARAPDGWNGGLGLDLVDRLAAHWGVSHERGTQVWFELAVHRAAA